MKICSRCNLEKGDECFGKRAANPSGVSGWCAECSRQYQKEWVLENKEKSRQTDRNWRQNNKERVKLTKKACILKNQYGLLYEEFIFVQEYQKFKCAICLRPLDRPNVDHSHATGETRGLICWACNNSLGKFRDNPEILRRAADYLDNPPIEKILGSRRFGLPGRTTTSKKRRIMLAKKAIEAGLVPEDAYKVCAPDLFENAVDKGKIKGHNYPRLRKQEKLVVPNS